MKAIGYIRSAVKDETGEVMGRQTAEIVTFCKNKGLELIHIFKDNGASGVMYNREGWQKLKDYLQDNNGRIQSLVVPEPDRIGRDFVKTRDEIAIMEQEYKIEVCFVKSQVKLEKVEHLLNSTQTDARRRNGKRKSIK